MTPLIIGIINKVPSSKGKSRYKSIYILGRLDTGASQRLFKVRYYSLQYANNKDTDLPARVHMQASHSTVQIINCECIK